MKHNETLLLSSDRAQDAKILGIQIARLRQSRRLRQADVAVRAGVSRSTAGLIEAGDPRRTLGQVLRYLEAIAPGVSLLDLLQESDPALVALSKAEATKRVRKVSEAELRKLDF